MAAGGRTCSGGEKGLAARGGTTEMPRGGAVGKGKGLHGRRRCSRSNARWLRDGGWRQRFWDRMRKGTEAWWGMLTVAPRDGGSRCEGRIGLFTTF
ncbi:YraN family protein [Sesbania bispinosa]|nr:YraN family protein [Sesbania bispinosa]